MMDLYFEIKYLELKWYNQDILTKVTESLVPLSVEYNEHLGIHQVETTIYPKVEGVKRGVLAVRFLNQTSDKPYVELPNGEKKYLSSIMDPETGLEWWFLKERWGEDLNHWSSIAPNIAGMVRLVLQGKICKVLINGSDFTLEQLERYLKVFKNDLWELILDESSVVQGKAKGGQIEGIGEEAIKCIESLVAHAHKVLINPKVELREIQSLKPRKEVRPVNRTFMEISTKANQKYLTSRATESSYNVPENRYVLFALERCYRIIKQIVILAGNKMERFKLQADKLRAQHDALKDHSKVDRDLVVADLRRIGQRGKKEYWQSHIDTLVAHYKIPLSDEPLSEKLRIKIEGATHRGDGFFFQIWSNDRYKKPVDRYYVLALGGEFEGLLKVIETGMELEFDCEYHTNRHEKFVNLHFDDIHSVTFINSKKMEYAVTLYEKEIDIGIELSERNWIRKLTDKELREQEKEKSALRNRIAYYEYHQMLSIQVYEKSEPKLRVLKTIINQLKDTGVKPSSIFPNSMTFVQNPNYQAIYNNYKNLRKAMNLQDENLLISLEKIEEIGLVNMPLLYERWSLIQIIMVLKNVFRFVPQDDWKYSVINAIKSNSSDISINLVNENGKRNITLWYEKRLPNKKKPDFTLDLTWFEEDDLNNSRVHHKKFIMDSKFYDKATFGRDGGLIAKINELYEDKNYSEDGQNPVFLIHPCNNVIDKRVTAQDWGQYSYLGEVDYQGNGEYYAHDRGAIYLNPIDDRLYSDELQRLLGMFLQYKLDSDMYRYGSDKTLAVPMCIRCGSNNLVKIEKNTFWYDKDNVKRSKTQQSVWMTCSECEQMQVYNHCSSRNHQSRIIKNGLYWSYHSARAIEMFNIKCPECGSWGGW